MNENILWDKKITKDEAKKILSDEKNQKFIYLASTILSRTNDAKKIFIEYLDKILFCKNWNRIKRRMRKNKWNDQNIDFWDEVYTVVKKDVEPTLLKTTIKKVPITPKIKKIGDSIRDFREKADLTQKELASKTKLSQQTISSLERGHLNFSFETLIKILNALNLRISIESRGEFPTGTNTRDGYIVKHEGAAEYEWRSF